MRLYLGPASSLELIRYLRATNLSEGIVGETVRRKRLDDAVNTAHQLDELDATAQFWLRHVKEPVQAFVDNRARGASTKRLVTCVFSQSIPYGAFLYIGHGICICSPKFAFMRLSSQLTLIEAISIGMELCGTYSRWRLKPEMAGDPYFSEHSETRGCTFNLPPIMHASHARAFIERLSGYRGSASARAVLNWVLDGAASPMEAALYLLLCLPKRLGGYGLPKPLLNPKLTISNPDGAKERYPDLFWKEANIDVEYNSDVIHSGEWSRYRDSKREIELTVANVRVLPLTRPQLLNSSEFDAFARGLRRMLGIRSRSADAAWIMRRHDLRQNLLTECRS